MLTNYAQYATNSQIIIIFYDNKLKYQECLKKRVLRLAIKWSIIMKRRIILIIYSKINN